MSWLDGSFIFPLSLKVYVDLILLYLGTWEVLLCRSTVYIGGYYTITTPIFRLLFEIFKIYILNLNLQQFFILTPFVEN